jgi:pimeloyl-ACP methyl ester carboxylesterase
MRKGLVGFSAVGVVAAWAVTYAAPPAKPVAILSESYHVPSSDAGIQLYVRNKHPRGMATFSADRTVLYVHGTTQASETTFDLALEQGSWMDYIARNGFDVYLVDLRGYGRSTKPPGMDGPAKGQPPLVTSDVALRDVEAAVEHVLRRHHVAKLDLVAWSWGCTLVAAYAIQHPDKVNRLVLYAPQWVSDPPATPDTTDVGAYQTWTPAEARKKLQAGVPEAMRKELLPDTWFEMWAAAALETDPVASKRDPPAVRTPSGSLHDANRFWKAGKAYYDPARIVVPTLVIRGEWDGVQPSAQGLFRKLVNAPERRFVEIGAASHFAFLERNRTQLFQEVQAFLDVGAGPRTAHAAAER